MLRSHPAVRRVLGGTPERKDGGDGTEAVLAWSGSELVDRVEGVDDDVQDLVQGADGFARGRVLQGLFYLPAELSNHAARDRCDPQVLPSRLLVGAFDQKLEDAAHGCGVGSALPPVELAVA